MPDKVVDASALVALLFNEVTRDSVLARLRGASLHAPILLKFEIASACLKKMRASPAERDALLQAFSLLETLSVELHDIDYAQAILLAERADLTVYDAAYPWLAHALGVELVTLDEDLARSAASVRGTAPE